MADTAKYTPINGGTLVTDFKSHFSLMKTKRTIACAYVFVFFFIVFTIFLAFSPSANSSSPWFTNIFTTSISNSSKTAPDFSDESYRSHFPSVFSYFFPNSSSQVYARSPNNTISPITDKVVPYKANQSTPLAPTSFPNVNSSAPLKGSSEIDKGSSSLKNETQDKELFSKGDVLKSNQSSLGVTKSPESSTGEKNATASTETSKNGTNSGVLKKQGVAKPPESSSGVKNVTSYGVKSSPGSNSGVSGKQGLEDLVKSLINCNLYDGNWVRDESYPLYKPGSCSLIDEQFNCFLNGRPDHDYYKLKWKPKGCTLPRLNGTHMLELLRGKRLAFVGDSLNRNMWESLVCILKNSVKDQKKVYEESGKHIFRGEASYSFIFEEYKCRIEFFVSPFLVREWEIAEKNGAKKETLRLDLIGKASDKYKNADVLIFNTGHWWTHEKTSKGKDYYQEGSHVYNDLNVLEAFRKALTTWGRWVDANINPKKTHVMFRGYSATHFSGGQWNSGGQCDHETEPIKNDTYLTPYSSKMVVFEKVLTGMKTHVSYLNITRLTDYRKDGHPSAYRKLHMSKEEKTSPHMFQDCSHWCLPGVPDGWNELLYAELLLKQMQNH